MIVIKTPKDIEIMRLCGKITAGALHEARKFIQPGVTTADINRVVHEYITSHGAVPSFLGYGGFPGSACVSVNDEVIHGIPGKRRISDGDVVSIDVGACYRGFHTDMADTVLVGNVSESAKKLYEVTRGSFFKALEFMKPGYRIGDISSAVQKHAESNGFYVVRDYVGHGVGMALHEEPSVPNFGTAGRGLRLEAGMTLAVEPMINETTAKIKVLSDKWTVVTADGGLSAHYENTVYISDSEPELLTVF